MNSLFAFLHGAFMNVILQVMDQDYVEHASQDDVQAMLRNRKPMSRDGVYCFHVYLDSDSSDSPSLHATWKIGMGCLIIASTKSTEGKPKQYIAVSPEQLITKVFMKAGEHSLSVPQNLLIPEDDSIAIVRYYTECGSLLPSANWSDYDPNTTELLPAKSR